MKSFLRIPLILILVCCLSCSFSAVGVMAESSVISVNCRFDVDSSMLYVEGTVKCEKGNLPLVLKVEHENEIITVDQLVTGNAANGMVSFAFNGIPFKNTSPSGKYNIYVAAAFINEETTVVYDYIGPDKRFAFIKLLNDAVESGKGASVISAIGEYKDIVTNGDETLFSLVGGKNVFGSRFIKMGKYELPDGYEDDEDIAVLTDSIRKIAANFKEALCFAEAADVSGKADILAWVDKYADAKGLFEDDPATAYNEAAIKVYFNEAIDSSGFSARVASAAKSAGDFAELKEKILKSCVVELLQNGKPYKIQELTEKNSDLIGVDTDNFNKLSYIDKANVYNDLAEETFSSIEDYVKKFDKLVNNYLEAAEESKSSSASSSNKSRGSGGGGGSKNVQTIGSAGTPSSGGSGAGAAGSSSFADLEDCEWVKPAVTYLTSNGVVSGKSANVFDPYTPVTRAEFTKMVVLAFKVPSEKYEGNFSDVSDSDWFAPYVAAAFESGIVNGMGDGTFAPYAQITRQDMAVLLFRAKGMTPLPEEKDVYYDSADISDYAKSAVFALYFNGIALGYGDGTYGPLNNATRAEAAQMIYKTVTFDK